MDGVTWYTKVKRLCKGNKKTCAVVIAAALGGAAYGAYKLYDAIHDPSPTPGPGPNGKSCTGTLKLGCKGDNIKEFQQELLDSCQKLPRKGVDGWYGPETKAAVMAFQKENGLTVDGVAGPKTLAALKSGEKNCAGKEPEKPEKPEAPEAPEVNPSTDPSAGKTQGYADMGDPSAGKTQGYADMGDGVLSKEGGGPSFPGVGPSITGQKSSPYWMTNKWKDARPIDRTEELKQQLIAQGYADETNWKQRKAQSVPMQESKMFDDPILKSITKRNLEIQKLVFERLVKDATRSR
jgi:hypothetical protein